MCPHPAPRKCRFCLVHSDHLLECQWAVMPRAHSPMARTKRNKALHFYLHLLFLKMWRMQKSRKISIILSISNHPYQHDSVIFIQCLLKLNRNCTMNKFLISSLHSTLDPKHLPRTNNIIKHSLKMVLFNDPTTPTPW